MMLEARMKMMCYDGTMITRMIINFSHIWCIIMACMMDLHARGGGDNIHGDGMWSQEDNIQTKINPLGGR